MVKVLGQSDECLEQIRSLFEHSLHGDKRVECEIFRNGPNDVWIRVLDPNYADISLFARYITFWIHIKQLSEQYGMQISRLILLPPSQVSDWPTSEEFDAKKPKEGF